MKSLRLLFVVIGLAVLSMPARASMTVEEFLSGRGNQDDLTNAVYVWGVMDALGAFDDAIRVGLGQTLFCKTDEVEPPTVERMVNEIEREIEFSRKRVIDFEAYSRDTTIGEVGLIVLTKLYGCEESP